MEALAHPETPGALRFRRRLQSPLLGGYFLVKLPLAALAGLSVAHLDGERCEARVPFGWRSQNPFGSIYFAALSMAAELSTAGLALQAAHAAPRSVSALPIALAGSFEKKATRRTRFVCADGPAVFGAVNEALRGGRGTTCITRALGTLDDGTVVARFEITWSFKAR